MNTSKLTFFTFCLISFLTPYEILAKPKTDTAVPIQTRGQIERGFIATDGLHLSGCLYTFHTTPPINKLKVNYVNKKYLVDYDLATQNNRFDIVIPLTSQERHHVIDSLITITPMSNNQEGYSFYYVLNSVLPLPPQSEVEMIGGGDLMAISNQFLAIFKDRCGLKDTDNILDVGCGLGRMAYSLAYYLQPTAQYKGFDIIPGLVFRAQASITPWFPNFEFKFVDAFNPHYNPSGQIPASTLRFPYDNEQFDFVFLASVFTHMTPLALKHYISEIKRVLKPGGKCMTTVFLMNDENRALMAQGKSSIKFIHQYGECFIAFPHIPEAAVAYDQNLITHWFANEGLALEQTMPGLWAGRTEDWVTYQDVLLFRK